MTGSSWRIFSLCTQVQGLPSLDSLLIEAVQGFHSYISTKEASPAICFSTHLQIIVPTLLATAHFCPSWPRPVPRHEKPVRQPSDNALGQTLQSQTLQSQPVQSQPVQSQLQNQPVQKQPVKKHLRVLPRYTDSSKVFLKQAQKQRIRRLSAGQREETDISPSP